MAETRSVRCSRRSWTAPKECSLSLFRFLDLEPEADGLGGLRDVADEVEGMSRAGTGLPIGSRSCMVRHQSDDQ